MFVYDVQSLELMATNEALLTLYGHSGEDLTGRKLTDFFVEEQVAELKAVIATLAREPAFLKRRWRNRKSDGSLIDVEVFSRPIDFSGRQARLVHLDNVTERVRTDRALRESELRLTQILQNSPLPMFVIDAEHRVVVWNPACERIFGYPAEKMLGTRDQWRAFYPDPRPVMADIVLDGGEEPRVAHFYPDSYRRSTFNPHAFEAEGFFPSLGDRQRWLYFTASPLRDADGKIIGAVETLLDISERKAAEHQAQRLNEELEARVLDRTAALKQANEELRLAMDQLVQTEKLASLGSLVAGVAHELNTPLGNILTVATTLRDRSEDFAANLHGGSLRRSTVDNFVASCLDATTMLERSANRAADLIGNFKQVAVDQTSVRRRRFDLAGIIEEVLSTLRPKLRTTHHRLRVEVPPDITLDSYPGPLEQIITNFVINSLVHGFDGIDAGTMTIRARAEADRVYLGYEDDGLGMAENVLAHAFDPFFTTRLGSGGSGLGLYIVYNLVTALLGGSIQLYSVPGRGTRFELSLPRHAPHSASAVAPTSRQATQSRPGRTP